MLDRSTQIPPPSRLNNDQHYATWAVRECRRYSHQGSGPPSLSRQHMVQWACDTCWRSSRPSPRPPSSSGKRLRCARCLCFASAGTCQETRKSQWGHHSPSCITLGEKPCVKRFAGSVETTPSSKDASSSFIARLKSSWVP